MATLDKRSKIEIIDPTAAGADCKVSAGGLTIDLEMLQEKIDDRRLEVLSWSHLNNSLIQSTTLEGRPIGKGEFFDTMLDELKKVNPAGITPSNRTKINAEYPSPIEGYAQAIGNYFDLATVSPRLNDLLEIAEAKSLKKGAEHNKKIASAHASDMSEDGTEGHYGEDSIAPEAEAADTGEHRITAGNKYTFVSNTSEPHHQAHTAARKVRPGTAAWVEGNCGQFKSILELARDARGDKGWQERAAPENRPFSDRSSNR